MSGQAGPSLRDGQLEEHNERQGGHTRYLGLLDLLEEMIDLCVFGVRLDGGALFLEHMCSLRHGGEPGETESRLRWDVPGQETGSARG